MSTTAAAALVPAVALESDHQAPAKIAVSDIFTAVRTFGTSVPWYGRRTRDCKPYHVAPATGIQHLLEV